MNILLTGGSGFIGKNLLSQLKLSSHKVLAISRSSNLSANNIFSHNVELSNIESLKYEIENFNPEIVIHLAWEGIPDFSLYMCQKNLVDSINFMEFIIKYTNCSKIIVSGSCFEYGKSQGVCKESDMYQLNSYFTWAKHSLNQYLSIKCDENNIVLNWFRLFYVYGPGQRDAALIPTLIKSISHKEVPKIKTPMNKNDFIYIDDVVSSIVRSVKAKLPSGIYNLGSGYATSVHEICQIVEKFVLGSQSISKEVLANGELEEKVNFWASINKITKLLKPNINTDLNNGIKKHIDSYEL